MLHFLIYANKINSTGEVEKEDTIQKWCWVDKHNPLNLGLFKDVIFVGILKGIIYYSLSPVINK